MGLKHALKDMGLDKALDTMANKYKEFFGTRKDVKSQVYAEALDLIATEMYKKPEKLIEIGINSSLIRYLATGVKRDLIDRIRAMPELRLRKTTEADLSLILEELADLRQSKHEEAESLDLEVSTLQLDGLTLGEKWIVQEVLQGLDEGYEFDSKEGASFTQRWVDDYVRYSKRWERAKIKLSKEKRHLLSGPL